MPESPFRCSAFSESAGESMSATASQVRSWLLLEHDGPWGRDALAHARLPADTGDAIQGHARRHGVRPILIRRHGRTSRSEVAAFAVHSGLDTPWIERFALARIEDALDLDLEALRAGRSMGGSSYADPLFLVCTHGRHDPCCAERGRPLARAVAGSFPDAAWECSHIGGDRFAGNLVAFPHGLYFGRVEALDGPRVARAYLEGRIALDRYRGRSCYPMVVQAAEHFVRRAHAFDGVDDVNVLMTTGDEAGASVEMDTPVGRLRVRVAVAAGSAQRLTCHSEDAQPPPVYRLVEMTSLSGGDPGP